MAANVSLQRFIKLTQDLRDEVRQGAIQELNAQGQSLVELMESVAPRGATGELEHSIRKIPGSSDTQIRIVAGDLATTRQPSDAGFVRDALRHVGIGADQRPYNYVRADEFGTVHMQARPFFWPSYRLKKKAMISAMKTKIRAAIKKRSAE